jgi:hypothetical protein
MFLGVWESVRQWTSTLPSEFPLWDLESRWTLESLESDCKGQNQLHWKVPYIIKKFLEHRCLKWACMIHLGTQNTSYGQKKGRESNWQFDSRPLKMGNRPDFLAFRWRATYHWKTLDEGYNFVSNLTSIGSLNTKLWAFKVMEVPFGSPRTKWHLNASPVAKHNTIRGKVVASPKSRSWWVLWVRVCSWLVHAPKVL